MPTVALTKDDFADVVQNNEIVLIDFWASWCGPCRTFAPIFESAAEANPDIVFAKIDTEAEPELAAAFDVRSIPTIMVFRDKVMLFAQPGALPQSALTSLIQQVRDLDMDAVKEQISAGSEG